MKFYRDMKRDTEEVDDSVLAVVFDYMQNITLPRIAVQETFYLRQLTVSSIFCIHNLLTNKVRMYISHEKEAKKSPNKVRTFLMDYILHEIEKRHISNKLPYTMLHLYSDNCGGQNMNHCVLRFMTAWTDNGIFQEAVSIFL